MAAKDKPLTEKPAKKKAYKKPTADTMAEKDLAGVSGGEGLERCGCDPHGGLALHACSKGGMAKGCSVGGWQQ